MRKIFTLKFLLLLFVCATGLDEANAQGKIVISQVYGGGGNAGATLKNDFIELFNSGNAPVAITGWSVQYASSAGTTWQVTNLSGTVPAGGYYLVQEAAGTGGTIDLPMPNASGSIAMSATAGKVALVNATTALTGTGCPFPASVVDFVGYGGANCSETLPTPILSNTTAALRKNNRCTDANNNFTDFEILAPSPRNSGSPLNQCGVVSKTISIGTTTNASEPSTTGSFAINFSPSTSASTTFSYTLSGSATFNSDYSVSLNSGATPSPLTSTSGTITVPSGVSTLSIIITPIDDLTTEGNETIILNISDPSEGYTVVPASSTATINLNDNDFATTLIHTIQGSGAAATPGTYAVEGIVTAVYPYWSPAGFYIQEEDADADTDPNTSEGIFIVQNNPAVSIGDKVKVTGSSQENASAPSFNQGVISASSVTVISNGQTLPTPVSFTLPVNMQSNLEKYEGMLVQYSGTLTVSDNSELGNRGSLKLSAGGVIYQPTQVVDPNDEPSTGINTSGNSNVGAVTAYTLENTNRSIILDDGSNVTPTSLPYVNVENTNRVGSTITNLTGILGFGFSTYRIHPVTYAAPVFNFVPRPALTVLGGNLKVASFNVLNYFNGNGLGAGFPTSRGANSLAEFARQRAKIISAITDINADIVGLLELENDGTGANSAIQDLVNGLNAVMGAGTYAFINDGATVQTFNTDEIRAGIIYKPSRVTPVGSVMTTSSDVFERPPLAHNFKLNGISMEFNYIINHFKSKGGCPSSGINADQGDGQACWNERRKQQATELINFINAVVIPASGNDRILSMGDYNAYFEEDPMDIFRASGYTVPGSSSSYSFNFEGQLGSLDHAVVSNSMLALLTGFTKWNINSVEPSYLDYNDAIRDAGESASEVNPWASTYTPSPWRSSDHDALITYFNIPKSTDVLITKSAPGTINSGAALSYTLTVTNNGPDEAENISLTDVLPVGATFVSLTAPAGWTTTQPAVGSNGTVTGSIAALSAAAGSQTFTLVVTAACELANNSVLENTSTLNVGTPDPNTTNNSATASTTVVASTPIVTIPDAFALSTGVLPNTVYIGYAPASSLILTSNVTDGTAPYSYSWFDGTTTSMSSSITVSPTVPNTYTLTVTDANGCQGTASKYINVIDIRGGKKLDKVAICHKQQVPSRTLVVGHDEVSVHLAHGDMLGACVSEPVTNKTDLLNIILNKLDIKVLPNPSSNYFILIIAGISDNKKASLKVTDLIGRIVEYKDNIQNNSTLKIGHNYQPGMYIIEFIHGTARKQFKIIKSGN